MEEHILRKANDKYKAGDYTLAIALYRQAQTSYPVLFESLQVIIDIALDRIPSESSVLLQSANGDLIWEQDMTARTVLNIGEMEFVTMNKSGRVTQCIESLSGDPKFELVIAEDAKDRFLQGVSFEIKMESHL